MRCSECGAMAVKGLTTSVTVLGYCLVIVRYVPCFKCTVCNEIIYTGDAVQQLERIGETAKKLMQEIAGIDYSVAA